nr:calmodulin-alpha-like isoform X1 [Globicephala melas]
MAEQLSKEQAAEFMETFHRFDKDKDSAISTQELGAVMQERGLNPSEAALKGFIARDDADGDGVISSQEFLAVIAKGVQARAREDDLRTAFHAFDLDGDGHISMDELKQAMAQLEVSQEELDIMIREADVDQDGQWGTRPVDPRLMPVDEEAGERHGVGGGWRGMEGDGGGWRGPEGLPKLLVRT